MSEIFNNYISTGFPPNLRGNGTISHITTGFVMKRDGTPSKCKFYVMDRSTRTIVYSGLSNSNGEWSVSELNPSRYFTVVNVDEANNLNAGILDWVQPQ